MKLFYVTKFAEQVSAVLALSVSSPDNEQNNLRLENLSKKKIKEENLDCENCNSNGILRQHFEMIYRSKHYTRKGLYELMLS